ncbi:MAG: lathosterol oxidase [Myxococcota bacterium]|jgi:lathosterol oxidase
MYIDWPMLLLCLFGSISAGLAIFHAVAAYYHVRYYVLRRDDAASWKCQPDRWLRPKQQRDAALLSSFNLALGGFITGLLIYAMTQGWETPIFLDASEYGWPYTIFSTALLFVLNDGAAYYVHRALHIKPIFKRIHRHHHRYVATSPYVTTAVHPLELLALQGGSFLPLFFIPFWGPGIGIVLTYILVWNIMDHSGVKMGSILPWQGSSMYHDDHHAHFHVNFGQHLQIFDRLHGTLRRQGRKYGVDNFGGRGESAPEAAQPDPFVNY